MKYPPRKLVDRVKRDDGDQSIKLIKNNIRCLDLDRQNTLKGILSDYIEHTGGLSERQWAKVDSAIKTIQFWQAE
jgi:hypothetical protein